MTHEDLRRCERELRLLTPREAASAAAQEAALAFNADASQARSELLEPARAILDSGQSIPVHDAACIARKTAELAFWRRVLRSTYPGDLGAETVAADYLLRYLLY